MIGFVLIPVARLGNKALFWIALVLMLQPYEWYNVIKGLQNPAAGLHNPAFWAYFGKMGEYITGGSLFNVWLGNLTNGKLAVLNWTWENGRVFQTASLFIFGLLAGRKALFETNQSNKKFWFKALAFSAVLFIPLFFVKSNMGLWVEGEALKRPLSLIATSWGNMAFMLVLVSGFMLLFQTSFCHRALNSLAPIGRMSLSNYILQSIVGSFIYYGFGLGLYQYTGATYCLLIGIVLAILQGWFSTWWMKSHRYGPLEAFWHKATWIGAKQS